MTIRRPKATKRFNERGELAEELKKRRAKRNPEQQLMLLDKRLGKGEGAKQERKRLMTELLSG